jgi:hypothetical protein
MSHDTHKVYCGECDVFMFIKEGKAIGRGIGTCSDCRIDDPEDINAAVTPLFHPQRSVTRGRKI